MTKLFYCSTLVLV